MRLITALLFGLFAAFLIVTGAYADILTATVNRDNGVTQTTEPLVLTPANLGAVKAADFKVKNLLSAPYNIKNDGTDQGAAINAILAAAVDGDAFYLPAGTYGHSVPIVLPDKMIKVYGDGPHATFFKALGTMTNGIYRAASSSVVYRCELSNFGILGEKYVSYGLRIEAWKQPKINRIYIEDVLVEGMTLGQNNMGGAANMFYEANVSDIEVYQKTGGWLPDPSLRLDKGVHLLNSASDNDISHVVVAYAKTAGFHDESSNNRYSHIHPWAGATYPMQFGIEVLGGISISQGEFDGQAQSGVKLLSTVGQVTVSGSQFINGTPTGVIIQGNTPDVSIINNRYDSSVTNAYIIYGAKGANFTFIDKGSAEIPGLVSNTTGNAATATALAINGTNCSAGYYPLGIDAQGNAESCTQATGGGISALIGDVTASGSGSVAATVVSASTTQAGKVQLTDSTSSNSTTTAATPNSVKNAYDLAAAKAPTAPKYILQDVDASLPNAQALKGMSNGLLKNTFATGVLSIATHPTDYYASGDSVSVSRVAVSGTGLASGTAPVAIFPTVINADVINLSSTIQNLDATTGTYKSTMNLNTAVVPTATKTDEYYGIRMSPNVKASGGTSYDLGTYKGISLQPQTDSGYSGTISNMYGIEIVEANKNGGSATYTNQYGLRVGDITTGVTNYSIYTGTGKVYHGDKVGIGVTPSVNLDIQDSSGGTGQMNLWSNSGTTMSIRGFSATAATRPVVSGNRGRGTISSPAAVQSGDKLGTFSFGGYDSAATPAPQQGAAIDFFANGTISSGNVPADISFATGTNSGNRTERLRITSGGMMAEGLTDYTASFTVANSTSSIVLASGTATVTLPKTLPAGSTSVTVKVSGAAASGVTFAAESGGSMSWGDAGTPTFTNSKRTRAVCVSDNTSATTTAAWDCMVGGAF